MTSKAPSNNDLQRAAGEGMVDERLGNANTQPGLSPVLRTDLSIETAVKDVLRVAPIDSDGIIVSVSGGEVTLKGDVRTAEMKDLSLQIAQRVSGVTSVVNKLELAQELLGAQGIVRWK